MKLVRMECPSCHGQLDVKEEQGQGFVKCPFCGTMVYLDEEKPDVNQTIYIDQLNIGGEKKEEKTSPLLTLAVSITIVLIALLMIAVGGLWRHTAETAKASYRTAPQDPAVREFLTQAFGQSYTALTAEQLERVRYLRIEREDSEGQWDDTENHWIFIWAEQIDDVGAPVNPVQIETGGTKAIELEDMQIFAALQALDIHAAREVQWSEAYSDRDIRDLKNLAELHYFQGGYGFLISELSEIFADPSQIYNLGAIYFSDREDLERLSAFTGLRMLSLSLGDNCGKDLHFLSGMQNLGTLWLSFGTDTEFDLSALSTLSKLKSLYLSSYGAKLENITVLMGLPQLEQLQTENVDALKDLSFVRNMPKLRVLDIDGSPLLDLEGLRDALSLQELRMKSCYDLKDVSALSTLRSLKKLKISGIWNFDIQLPALQELSLLEEVEIECWHLDAIAGMPSIRRLQIYETCLSYSLEPLRGMQELRELYIRSYHSAKKGDLGAVLAALPALEKLTFSYGSLMDGADYADVFSVPTVKEFVIKPDDAFSSYVQLSMSHIKDNPVLERLDLSGIEIENLDRPDERPQPFGVYAEEFLSHFPGLKSLNVSGTKLDSLDFVRNMPELAELDISDNYITDLTPLAGLPNLKKLVLRGNPVQNPDILPDTVEMIR